MTPFAHHLGWPQLFGWTAFVVAASFGGLLQFGIGRKALALVAAPTSLLLLANFGVWIGGVSPHEDWLG